MTICSSILSRTLAYSATTRSSTSYSPIAQWRKGVPAVREFRPDHSGQRGGGWSHLRRDVRSSVCAHPQNARGFGNDVQLSLSGVHTRAMADAAIIERRQASAGGAP
eukprot:6121851-Prymnesium_polylepis.2